MSGLVARLIPRRLLGLVSALRQRGEDMVMSVVTPRVPLPSSVADRRVVLVGASVGRAWRLHAVFPGIQTLDLYEFDKTEAVERALASRPDLIIVKECAAYFPLPDEERARELVGAWVRRIRQAGTRAALATVVPVTREHASRVPGRAEGLRAFNDWVRAFSATEQIQVLDLEAAVRCSSADRHLDEALHSGDGLHLRRSTYRERLDSLIPPLLLRAFSDG